MLGYPVNNLYKRVGQFSSIVKSKPPKAYCIYIPMSDHFHSSNSIAIVIIIIIIIIVSSIFDLSILVSSYHQSIAIANTC